MLSLHKKNRSFFLLAPFAAVAGTLLCKLHPIIGSQCSFFTLTDALIPLSGSLNVWLCIVINLMRYACKISTLTNPTFFLLYHTPGIIASIAWSQRSWITQLLIPALCMALFIFHPIGFQALPYSFYWLIPMALYIIRSQSIFCRALSSTFIAHAVGSVIWLYTKQLLVSVWWGLIPLVPFERFFYALLMTIFYYGILNINYYLSSAYQYIDNVIHKYVL